MMKILRGQAGFCRPLRLISKTQLFSPEELTELYRATDYLLDEGPELEDGHLKAMQTARTKIEYTVPDLADRLEQDKHRSHKLICDIRKSGSRICTHCAA